ncbi:hypothetical protein [Caballeronia novacaledonica]|uniref:Uncharacterized protein n=1 Tax=Caballeronia novacaledonica TaxID=1544861 RepID=A0AA37MJC3_9BURK|nr:hypothetical protein [Caballeronia novacaledonica]GJH29308.1 hypothetical protein CBA19CS42_32350 [Caballeronia novacaledonica]
MSRKARNLTLRVPLHLLENQTALVYVLNTLRFFGDVEMVENLIRRFRRFYGLARADDHERVPAEMLSRERTSDLIISRFLAQLRRIFSALLLVSALTHPRDTIFVFTKRIL